MKNAVLIVLAFALGGGVVWYLTANQETSSGGQAARGGGFAGGFGGAGQGQPPLVVAERVARDQLYDTVEALGTAQANESVTISAKVTDTVRRVNFEDGDYVEAGAVLVELTNQEEEALLAEARANLDDAENQLRRLEDLSARGLAAVSELDVARSRAAASQARLNTVLARLRDRLIQAPFSGLLGFRQVSPGTLMTPNATITSIDDISTIKLDFTVPETYLLVLSRGLPVTARATGLPDRTFTGTVTNMDSRVDPVTRSVLVRAELPNVDGVLRQGMFMTVALQGEVVPTLIVPEEAIVPERGHTYVFVVRNNVVERREVRTGKRRPGFVEIVSGVAEQERVVVDGTQNVRDGSVVQEAGGES